MMTKKIPFTFLFVSIFLYSSGGNRDEAGTKLYSIERPALSDLRYEREPVPVDARYAALAGSLEREKSARIAAENEVISLKNNIESYQRMQDRMTGLLAAIFAVLVVTLFRYQHRKRTMCPIVEIETSKRTKELPDRRAYWRRNLHCLPRCSTARR